jgi:hypothetical protein
LGGAAAGTEAVEVEVECGGCSESEMVTGSGALEGVEELGSVVGEGSARAAAAAAAAGGRQSTARETVLKKLWRSEGVLGPTQVFPIAPARGRRPPEP